MEIDGFVEVSLRLRVPLDQAARVVPLVSQIGELALESGIAIEVEQPKQLAAPSPQPKRAKVARTPRAPRTPLPQSPEAPRSPRPASTNRHSTASAAVGSAPPEPDMRPRGMTEPHVAKPAKVGVNDQLSRCDECHTHGARHYAMCSKATKCPPHYFVMAALDGSETVEGVCKYCQLKKSDFDPNFHGYNPATAKSSKGAAA